MKILVYGAGNIGSLYAVLLERAGHEVSILARGKRLAAIREHGIELEDAVTGEWVSARVATVERLGAEDGYDLVLVVLPAHAVTDVLPNLAANRRTPSVLFFGNNAAGPGEPIGALGADRVLLGFPGAAAVPHDQRLRYLILSAREQPTTIGEPGGGRSARSVEIADALRKAGFPVSLCPDMDAWLKTHAAEIVPTANALYMAGLDAGRLARTRDALLLMLRSIREGYAVLSAHGIPITPRSHRVFRWLPEPLLLWIMRRALESDTTGVKIGHALAARNEIKTLAHQLRALAQAKGVATPAADRLDRYLDPNAPPVPDGSTELSVDWSGVWIALGGLVLAGSALSLAL